MSDALRSLYYRDGRGVVEIIDLNDHLHMVALATALVRRLDQAAVAGLTDYL